MCHSSSFTSLSLPIAALICTICALLSCQGALAEQPYSESDCKKVLALEGFFSRAEYQCRYTETDRRLEDAAVNCYASFTRPDVPEQLLKEGRANFDIAANGKGLEELCAEIRTRKNEIIQSFFGDSSQSDGSEKGFSFDRFPVNKVFHGRSRMPDFSGRDHEFADYKTRIIDGLRAGPNFAGHYSIIQFGCGTECTLVYVADNRTGQVFAFPRGGDDNLVLDLAFKLSSRLSIAQWTNAEGDKCTLEYFEWDGGEATLLAAKTLGNKDVCLTRRASDPID